MASKLGWLAFAVCTGHECSYECIYHIWIVARRAKFPYKKRVFQNFPLGEYQTLENWGLDSRLDLEAIFKPLIPKSNWSLIMIMKSGKHDYFWITIPGRVICRSLVEYFSSLEFDPKTHVVESFTLFPRII